MSDATIFDPPQKRKRSSPLKIDESYDDIYTVEYLLKSSGVSWILFHQPANQKISRMSLPVVESGIWHQACFPDNAEMSPLHHVANTIKLRWLAKLLWANCWGCLNREFNCWLWLTLCCWEESVSLNLPLHSWHDAISMFTDLLAHRHVCHWHPLACELQHPQAALACLGKYWHMQAHEEATKGALLGIMFLQPG